jgi:hypothetical protein
MSHSVRTELLAVLADLSDACPEMRFGQLIANLSTLAKGPSAEGLWDAEDDELLQAARQQLAYFREHRPQAALRANPLPTNSISAPSPQS